MEATTSQEPTLLIVLSDFLLCQLIHSSVGAFITSPVHLPFYLLNSYAEPCLGTEEK